MQQLNIKHETARFANLIFLVDRVDALCAQKAQSNPEASRLAIAAQIKNEIVELSGIFFDPDLVEAFLKASKKEIFWFNLEP